ncbi:MAG: bifunctional acetate--CoA ligase family protein/GNAT family N-acetyltransferase [Granulosicoccus sp.]
MSTLLIEKLLDPSSLVVIGASAREASPGFKLTQNLLYGGYKGTLFLVNPRYESVLDQPCFKSVKALPETPDLAIINVPSRILRRTLVQCSGKGILVAVVMSGTSKSQALHRYAQRLGMRLMGPYCAGLVRPHIGLNATYSANRIYKGNLAIISQSASLGAAMVDWAESSNVGFSAMLSTGQDTDITLSDLLDLLAEDWHTKAVIVYLERIHASRAFLSALSACARIKPVVLMRSINEGVQYCDALTRTGQVYNSDTIFQAALNRAGVVRIKSFSNLYAAARILSSGIRVKGNRLAVISNANAPAMMALERITSKEFEAPRIDTHVLEQLQNQEKVNIIGNNPMLLRDPLKLAEHYQTCIHALQAIPDIDAVLVIFVPDSRNDATLIAQAITACLPLKKPLLTCWMGDASVGKARETLAQAGIPNFRTPEAATDGFDFLHRYFVSQQQLLQLPNPASRRTPADVTSAKAMVSAQLSEGHRVLGPIRTHKLMELFDIPVLPSQRATSLEDAISMANGMGYPVAMKLVSPNISYKASVVNTQLNISTADEVEEAWKLINARLQALRPDAEFTGVLVEPMHSPLNTRSMAVSISRDPVFGPVISLGVGGELTALMHKRRVQLPPLNRFLINDLLDNTEFQVYLGAFRHTEAVDSKPLAKVLRRLSEIACELPEVFSLDINPLVLSEHGVMAIDVQVVLEQPPSSDRLYKHLAIHPYPWEWVRDVVLKDGLGVQLRPIRPEDAIPLQDMVREMSPQARFFRFMHAINELSPQMVAQFTKLDYERQMAFVATPDTIDSERNQGQAQIVIGACRYMISNNRLSGEFAVSISDEHNGRGLATQLMQLLIEHATSLGLRSIHGDVLRTNKPMQALMNSLGFHPTPSKDDHEVIVYSLALDTTPYKLELS